MQLSRRSFKSVSKALGSKLFTTFGKNKRLALVPNNQKRFEDIGFGEIPDELKFDRPFSKFLVRHPE